MIQVYEISLWKPGHLAPERRWTFFSPKGGTREQAEAAALEHAKNDDLLALCLDGELPEGRTVRERYCETERVD